MRFTCRAIIFDLDGVLVDSRECVERSWRDFALEHGLDSEAVLRTAHGRPAVETVALLTPHLSAATEAAKLAYRESHDADGVYEVPGARELLDGLPPERWAIVTSGTREVATFRLNLVRLPIPRVLVCAGEVRRGKPDPEGYLAAAAALGVAPEACLVIEDAPPGLRAARAAGMHVVALTTTYAAAELTEADAIAAALADLRIERYGDLLHISNGSAIAH